MQILSKLFQSFKNMCINKLTIFFGYYNMSIISNKAFNIFHIVLGLFIVYSVNRDKISTIVYILLGLLLGITIVFTGKPRIELSFIN